MNSIAATIWGNRPPSVFLSPHRQSHVRRTKAIVKDRIQGDNARRTRSKRVAGVRVSVPARETTARNRDADSVAGSEEVAGRPAVDDELFDLIWRKQPGGFGRIHGTAPAKFRHRQSETNRRARRRSRGRPSRYREPSTWHTEYARQASAMVRSPSDDTGRQRGAFRHALA